MNRWILSGCMILGAFLLVAQVLVGEGPEEKQVSVAEKTEEGAPESLQDIQNPDAGFEIELWTDREDRNYKVGEEVAFSFKTTRDCRMTLFNVGTSGKVNIFFPNQYQTDNLVQAGKTYRVPPLDAKYLLRMDAPAGVDLIKAIATIDQVALLTLDSSKPEGSVTAVNMPQEGVARDIGIALRPVQDSRWAEAEMIIKVVE